MDSLPEVRPFDELLVDERLLQADRADGAPRCGLALSGGGNRSAAFSIGVLGALHRLDLLSQVEVVSAVSGGSYALSWLMLQPYYRELAGCQGQLKFHHDAMFDVEGPYQEYLSENAKAFQASGCFDYGFIASLAVGMNAVAFNIIRVPALVFGRSVLAQNIAQVFNGTSIHEAYRSGIQWTYQVSPDVLTGDAVNLRERSERLGELRTHLDLSVVRPVTFPEMANFARRIGQPNYVFNTTVAPPSPGRATSIADRIFELTTIGFGSDSCGYVKWSDTESRGWEPGQEPLPSRFARLRAVSPFATVRNFNVAPAISGAALSGTTFSKPTARRAMRLVNVGIEYRVPRPGSRRRLVSLGDGGHSENLGAFALLRRRCQRVIIVDAEHDPRYEFAGYRRLKESARRDLGIELIVPDVEEALDNKESDFGNAVSMGMATSGGGTSDMAIQYIKLCLDRSRLSDYPDSVVSYDADHRQSFPHQSTGDQYFPPEQYRAYRDLGYHTLMVHGI